MSAAASAPSSPADRERDERRSGDCPREEGERAHRWSAGSHEPAHWGGRHQQRESQQRQHAARGHQPELVATGLCAVEEGRPAIVDHHMSGSWRVGGIARGVRGAFKPMHTEQTDQYTGYGKEQHEQVPSAWDGANRLSAPRPRAHRKSHSARISPLHPRRRRLWQRPRQSVWVCGSHTSVISMSPRRAPPMLSSVRGALALCRLCIGRHGASLCVLS